MSSPDAFVQDYNVYNTTYNFYKINVYFPYINFFNDMVIKNNFELFVFYFSFNN